jgi:hypothetical protein
MRSKSSRRRAPTSRSQIAFIRGARTAVRKTLVPTAWKTASNGAVKFDPRSRIRNLMSSNRSPNLLVSYLPAASLRCQASSVAGVTGKTPPSACVVPAAPARRTGPGHPAHTAPGPSMPPQYRILDADTASYSDPR